MNQIVKETIHGVLAFTFPIAITENCYVPGYMWQPLKLIPDVSLIQFVDTTSSRT